MSTATIANSAWRECVGAARWIEEPLMASLHYASPLPVQLAVVPTVSRALLSGIPMDVSLTAPTGSGKTLCYLLPMLQLVTAEKKGLNDTRLRALVLVPTKSLGQQVFRELTRLTRHTTISVASLCNESESMSGEADMLVRKVRAASTDLALDSNGGVEVDWDRGWCQADASPGLSPESGAHLAGSTAGKVHVDGAESTNPWSGNAMDCDGSYTSVRGFHFFSKVDILVATPQRLLRHLDATLGLSLAALRLLVIDEADQVLAGNFANFVVKVVERFEEEQGIRRAQERACGRRLLASTGGTAGCGGTAVLASQGAGSAHEVVNSGSGHILHKILCSATLSSRIGRISEVRLRNCQYFALRTDGTAAPLSQETTVTLSASSPSASSAGAGTVTMVRTDFALPPTLREHILFVEDRYRHAVLLKLVRTLLEKIAEQQAARLHAAALKNKTEEEEEENALEKGEEGAEEAKDGADVPAKANDGKGSSTYPEPDDKAGTGILVFCSSAEEARVMGHFLTAAGVRGVIEFTTLTTESERRRALLQSHSQSPTSPSASTPNIVVASDALMRGIDIPNTGHVIMYHPPESISQYIHRAGRTARAMRPGHLHVLLSKLGSSGTQADGEVAAFKKLSGLVTRTLPQAYERHFFMFAKAPAAVTAEHTTAVKGEDSGKKRITGKAVKREEEGVSSETKEEEKEVLVTKAHAEWWLAEANAFLAKSQQLLNVKWVSALETSGGSAATAPKVPANTKRPRSTSPTK